MTPKDYSHQGFTISELLAVILFVAVLAGIALPVLITNLFTGPQTQALGSGKQIDFTLFPGDYHGHYPSKVLNATGGVTATPAFSVKAAFAQSVPDYVPDEKILWLVQDRAECSLAPTDDNGPRMGPLESRRSDLSSSTENPDFHPPLIVASPGYGAPSNSVPEDSVGGAWKGVPSSLAKGMNRANSATR